MDFLQDLNPKYTLKKETFLASINGDDGEESRNQVKLELVTSCGICVIAIWFSSFFQWIIVV